MSAIHLLRTPLGLRVVSFILGLGFASLFYTACKGSKCLQFAAPLLAELNTKIFKGPKGKGCVKYNLETNPCQPHLATVAIDSTLSY